MSERSEKMSDAPKVRKVKVPADFAGQRLDNFLMRELKGVPRSMIYRLIRRGEVRVNGGRAKPDRKLQAQDEVRVPPVRVAEEPPPPATPAWLVEVLRNAVLYEDRDVLVLNKPAGLAVHGGSGERQGVIEMLRQIRPEGASLELVHRLDKATSGCLLVAKRRPALRALHGALRDGEVGKHYTALVRGEWPAARQHVKAPLIRNVLRSGERLVTVDEDGKFALTEVRVRAANTTASLLQVRLHTGRTHQIRVHATFAGHPLAGDDKYGDPEFNRKLAGMGLKRMFLHANRLEFGDVLVTAPRPDDLESLLPRLNLDI